MELQALDTPSWPRDMKIQKSGCVMGNEILNTNGYKEAVVKKEPVNGDMQSKKMGECGRSLFPYIYGSYASKCAAR